MSIKRLLRPVALVATLTLTVTACGGGVGGGQGDDTLKLGYVLPQTGQLAYLGPPQIQAAKFARAQINEAGGVLGKKIPKMVGGDESDQAAVAAQSADRVLAAGVDALIGAAASSKSLAIIDKVTGSKTVQCSGSNTAPTFTTYKDNGYYFRTAPSDALQGPVLANTVISDGHTKIAVMARADDYGKGLANATTKALEKAGATVAVNGTYDPKATNFDAVAQKIVNAEPDAAVIIAFEEGAQIIKALIEAGMGPDQIGIYGADGLRSAELGSIVSESDPAVVAGIKGTAPASAANEQFNKALKNFAPNLKELQFAPQVFDCVTLMALAAEAAGTDDPSAFKGKIVGITKGGTKCKTFAACKKLLGQGKDIDYDGKSGPLQFAKVGEPAQAQIEVYGYDENGELETLTTVKSKGLQ